MTLAAGLLIAAGAFLAAFASGLAGFAFALVASGVLLNVLSPIEAVPVILAGSILSQFATLPALRHAVRWRRLWPFLLGGALGVPFGVELLQIADPGTFRFGVGVFLIAYSGYMLLRPRPAPIGVGSRAADGAIGLVGGV
ncbi:MAG TPA: sulfite exporter TauE/SafE family protein, partial [Alphaproteobacteria bacterium]|nr:sulfite exporter TauE/SafE family protein [Alphaproteobacteria bacterium]